jgi:hypothetical protein
MPENQFECNDLRIVGDTLYVKRGTFGSTNYRCGTKIVKYKKKNWDYVKTGKTCPNTGNESGK